MTFPKNPLLLGVLLCLFGSSGASADVLLLKGGQRFEGDVVDTGKAYEIKISGSTLSFPKSEVAKRVPSIDALTADAEKIHTEARELYGHAIKPETDLKTANEELHRGVELLRKAADLYQEAREFYSEGKQALLDAATVKLLQEMRLYRDKMSSEIAKSIAPNPTPEEPKPLPGPEPRSPQPDLPAPKPAAPAKPAKPDLVQLRTKANAGDVEAMYAAALILEVGDWAAQEATQWFRSAADKGHLRAQVHLGMLALEGRGRRPDVKEAQVWLGKAEAKGEPLANVVLARMWFDGTAGARSLHRADALCERALATLRKDVLGGDPESMTALGWMHLEGLGTNRSGERAIEFLRAAGEQGDVRALVLLGQMFDQGRGVGADRAEAVKAFRTAAERGFAPAQWAYAEIHSTNHDRRENSGRDLKLARQWFQNAAKQGYPEGLSWFGSYLIEGVEGPKDSKEGFRLWTEALKTAGVKVRAQVLNSFGYCYYAPMGTTKDLKEAVKYWKEGAELGDAMAQDSMGWYAENEKRNMTEALRWYELSARQGLGEADMDLGDCYRQGKGVPKNLQEAERWYAMAVQKGVKDAEAKLAKVQQERGAAKR